MSFWKIYVHMDEKNQENIFPTLGYNASNECEKFSVTV